MRPCVPYMWRGCGRWLEVTIHVLHAGLQMGNYRLAILRSQWSQRASDARAAGGGAARRVASLRLLQ